MIQMQQDYHLRDAEEVQLIHHLENPLDIRNPNINFQKTPLGLNSLELYAQNFIQMKKLDFYYFKVKVLSRLSPLNLVFKSHQNLKIYLSTEALFPTKFNCQYTVFAKAVKILSENGRTFFDQYVYFSIHSEDDQDICILSHFGQQTRVSHYKVSKQEQDAIINQRAQNYESELSILHTYIYKVRITEKRHQMKLLQRRNIVQTNLNIKQYLRPLMGQLSLQKQVSKSVHYFRSFRSNISDKSTYAIRSTYRANRRS